MMKWRVINHATTSKSKGTSLSGTFILNSFYRYLLVSQGNHEIYLTLAKFDDNYINYLKGDDTLTSEPCPTAFLTMQEWGPFRINHASHVESLARIFVRLALQVTDEIKRVTQDRLRGR